MDLLKHGSLLAGRYRIGKRLGAGGTSEVYLADAAEGNGQPARQVAVKVLRPDRALSSESVARFQREARVVSQLRHPNLLEVFDFGEDQGRWYLVMERLEGIELTEAIELKGTYDLDEAASILDAVLSALDSTHSYGLVHRDVKPSNIFLARTVAGEILVKLVDFGIVQEVASGNVHLTETGFLVGTPGYVSPEQARGATIDARSDLYSLGCVMFEMLAGRPPYINPSPIKLLQEHVFAPVPSPRDFKLDLKYADQADAFLARALAKSPGDRYSSAEEMRTALAKMVASLGGPHESAPITLPPNSIGHSFGDNSPHLRHASRRATAKVAKAIESSKPPFVRLAMVAAASAILAAGLMHFLR